MMYILVQCIIHPARVTNSEKSWAFATAAYAVCWFVSVFIVWLGWEFGYEFWRRWCLREFIICLRSLTIARPAIEPIYLSLPASLHLALSNFDYFVFLTHIRLSPLGTSHASDIFPETCYALLQPARALSLYYHALPSR